jgi:hypothetical protein
MLFKLFFTFNGAMAAPLQCKLPQFFLHIRCVMDFRAHSTSSLWHREVLSLSVSPIDPQETETALEAAGLEKGRVHSAIGGGSEEDSAPVAAIPLHTD